MNTHYSNHTRRWAILAILGVAQLMVVLDATIVMIALPSAQKALHFTNTNRQWIVTAYALAFGSLLLLGGILTQSLSWRFSMYVNLVFALVAVTGVLALVHNSRPQTRPRLDILGTFAVSCGLFALVFGFSHAQTTSWGNHLTIGMLGAGVLLLALFVAQEARARNPLLPLRVLADRNRGASFLAIGISGAAIFGVFLFLTYYLQDLRGFSPIATGLAFLPLSVTIMSSAILGQTKLQTLSVSAGWSSPG